MEKEFSAIIKVKFSSTNENEIEVIMKNLSNDYGLFKSIGSNIIASEIFDDGGSISDKIPVWHKTYYLHLTLELQSRSLTNINHMISIYLHWAALFTAECEILKIQQLS